MIELVVFGALVLGAFALAARMNELFCVSVRDGRLLVVRGRVPQALLHDLADIAKRAQLARATIRGVRAAGHARLVTRGIDEGTTQRMRNAFGRHPLQKLTGLAAARSTRNVGQWLGVAWLAWLFAKSSDFDA